MCFSTGNSRSTRFLWEWWHKKAFGCTHLNICTWKSCLMTVLWAFLLWKGGAYVGTFCSSKWRIWEFFLSISLWPRLLWFAFCLSSHHVCVPDICHHDGTRNFLTWSVAHCCASVTALGISVNTNSDIIKRACWPSSAAAMRWLRIPSCFCSYDFHQRAPRLTMGSTKLAAFGIDTTDVKNLFLIITSTQPPHVSQIV